MTTIVFDTEWNRKENPEIIEAAWATVDSINNVFGLSDLNVRRFAPADPIEPGAMAVHHILDEDLVGLPPSSSFKFPAGVEYMIGHNVDADWKAAGMPEVKRICTLALARALWPAIDTHNQSAVLYYLSDDRANTRLRLKDAHAAAADVENCVYILHHIVTALNVASWEDLWCESEKARVPVNMPFGKHKGEPIAKIPTSYKLWLLNQPDVDSYLVKALKGEAA